MREKPAPSSSRNHSSQGYSSGSGSKSRRGLHVPTSWGHPSRHVASPQSGRMEEEEDFSQVKTLSSDHRSTVNPRMSTKEGNPSIKTQINPTEITGNGHSSPASLVLVLVGFPLCDH